MNIESVPKSAITAGIIDELYHERLLADIDRICARAGVPTSFVWSKLSEHLHGNDLEWVRAIKHSSHQGMVYLGPQKTPVEDSLMAIAGACLRNYIDVRFMPVQTVISRLAAGDMPKPTVLLIPNFYLDKGGNLADWNIPELLGLLYSRMANNLKTIIHVSSMSGMDKNYGESFRKHIEAHYRVV